MKICILTKSDFAKMRVQDYLYFFQILTRSKRNLTKTIYKKFPITPNQIRRHKCKFYLFFIRANLFAIILHFRNDLNARNLIKYREIKS